MIVTIEHKSRNYSISKKPKKFHPPKNNKADTVETSPHPKAQPNDVESLKNIS